MIKKAYLNGFMHKCAEYGIDGMKILKKAQYDSPLMEILKGAPAQWALDRNETTRRLGDTANGIGMFAGYMDDGDDYGGVSNYVPGMTSYHTARRNKRVAKEMLKKDPNSHPYANIAAEHIGGLTSLLLASGIGAGIGGLKGKSLEGAGNGALAGGGAAALASLIGTIRGLSKKRRTDEEQLARETTGRAVAKYLIPGLAAEDRLMRLGKSRDYFPEGKKEDSSEKDNNDNKDNKGKKDKKDEKDNKDE